MESHTHLAQTKLIQALIKLSVITIASLALPTLSFADAAASVDYKQEGAMQPVEVMMPPHWYVGANIGVSHTNDNATTTGSVKQTGPGWSVNGGYQFTPIWGGEIGFTQYHDSLDDLGSVNIASTEHYSVYLAATGQYPLFQTRLSALGKLGLAYNYARKSTPGGPTADARSVSAYGGLGAAYKLTQTVDVIGQWARAWGNDFTGSTDLYSIGISVALV